MPLNPILPRPWEPKIWGKSGLVSNASTGTVIESPLIELLAGMALGALAGLIVGFIITGVLRFLSIIMGRHIGGHAWTLYATLLGALLFGALTLTNDE